MAGSTTKPFQKAFACAAVAFVAVVIVTIATLGVPQDSNVAPELLGRLFAAVAIPAVIAGFFARRSANVWSMGKIIAVYMLALVVVIIATLGSMVKPSI